MTNHNNFELSLARIASKITYRFEEVICHLTLYQRRTEKKINKSLYINLELRRSGPTVGPAIPHPYCKGLVIAIHVKSSISTCQTELAFPVTHCNF